MKKRFTLLLLIIFLILIFINSDYLIANILEYTELFIKNLFFYTFIIYIISSLLVDYDLLELLNPKIYITIMSLISGFPSGAKYTKELLDKGYLDTSTANYLITYTHYPNPLFVIGSIKNIVTKKYALLILISIYLSSFITSRFFKVKNKCIKVMNNSNNNFSSSLSKSIINAFKTIIIIYGSCLIALIIGLLIVKIFNFKGIYYCLTFGITDLTKGIFSTVLLNNKRIRALLILLFINMASISIHMQVKQILDNSSLEYKSFLKGRIISTFFAIIIYILLS